MSTVFDYNPATAIPDLSGKVVFITGGTAGIGAATILEIVKHNPLAVYFSGRSASSATSVIDKVRHVAPSVKIIFIECDLASLSSVKLASESFLAQCERLDILICNAGVMALPLGLSKDGYEIQFGTNHMGHALLIKKLLPELLAGAAEADKRLIILSSIAYRMAPCGGIQFDKLKTTQDLGPGGPHIRYGQSKVANTLYARELARRYPELTTVSLHPGIVSTGITDGLSSFMKWFDSVTMTRITPEQGAYNTLWAAFTNRRELMNGGMYEPVGVPMQLSKTVMDVELATKLWEWTAKELEEY